MSCCSSSDNDGEKPVSPKIASSCPACRQPGQFVDQITPGHTLKKIFRSTLINDANYHFCENPECETVYFSDDGRQRFSTEQLINRVTCKDSSAETPLCYCYKITKGAVLKEYHESRQSGVLEKIEQKMGEKACFCDKSNPRGVCCTTEIRSWLKAQGITESESDSIESVSGCSSSCC